MAGTLIDVETDDFHTAAAASSTAAATVRTATNAAHSALSGSAQMAGSDPSGVKWSSSYDKAAQDAFQGLDALVTAFGAVSTGLTVTGVNYATADWVSSGHSGSAPGASIPALPVGECSAPPPSSSGGSRTSPIPGFHYVADFIGDMWPDGDTGKLNAAASAWSALADALEPAAGAQSTSITDALATANSPEMPAITTTVSKVSTNAGDLASNARAIGAACSKFATQIDSVHSQTEQELKNLLLQIEATAAISIGLTIFTAGISDAVGAGAVATEVGFSVTRILAFIAQLGRDVVAVVDDIAAAAGAFAKVVGVSEQVGVRVVTFAGKTVAFGVEGAGMNVVTTAIVDPKADLGDSALQGFVGGVVFGGLGQGVSMVRSATAARGAARVVEDSAPTGGVIGAADDVDGALPTSGKPSAVTGAGDAVPVVADTRPYLNGARPSFRKGVVERAWNAAKGPDGLVRDPFTNEVITWAPGQARKGVWDMGHVPNEKYETVHASYVRGEMSPKEFRDWYNDSDNYVPQGIWSNRSGLFE